MLNYGLGICSEKPKQMLKPGLFKYGRGMCSEEQPWHILNSFVYKKNSAFAASVYVQVEQPS